MQLTISHTTRYRYDRPAQHALQQVRLTPKSRAGQTIVDWRLDVTGGRKELSYDDQNNNHVDLVSFEPDATEIVLHSHGRVEMTNDSGIVGAHGGFAPLWYFRRTTDLTRPGPTLRKLARGHPRAGEGDDIANLHALMGSIEAVVRYETGNTHTQTSAEEAVEAGHGVCQDHAHVFIALARMLGYPARYVSGYLMMNDRIEQEATHAWAEAHVAGLGWVGFDVSNAISPDERYVRVATGLDYREAAPISGILLGAGDEDMVVTLQVQQ
ncbi:MULTISPECIES: transglutaminase family protein [unclassified Roseitalea]|uniref:transglutaminase family protein n=1 Tax=unclassified Roseitalea TaxID=2639107 RepID=UPI0027402C1D|nr:MULTISPECIES: transglutaminase family protein [unclassified Roseitalea]